MFENIQLWVEPILWTLGTITTIVVFIRLCKPLWKLVTTIIELPNQMVDLKQTLNVKFDSIEKQFDNQGQVLKELSNQNQSEDAITLDLLHDTIIQIYQIAKKENHISEIDYYRACELYKRNGGSQYIDSIMVSLGELHTKRVSN